MTDNTEMFNRILTALGAKNAPQAAKILGLNKVSVYEWREKPPGLPNLLRISELGNTSLDFLVTGKNKFPVEDEPEWNTVLESKIREIARHELSQVLDTKMEGKETVPIRVPLRREKKKKVKKGRLPLRHVAEEKDAKRS